VAESFETSVPWDRYVIFVHAFISFNYLINLCFQGHFPPQFSSSTSSEENLCVWVAQVFTAWHYASAAYAVFVCPSVCRSVCH